MLESLPPSDHSSFSAAETHIKGLFTVSMKIISDERGSIMESYRMSDYAASGLPDLGDSEQVNATLSVKGSIRGIHAEATHKFIQIAAGAVFAAIVDLRPDSETAGQWLGFNLERGDGLFVSRGLGNAFQSTSEDPSIYLYYFEKEWKPGMGGIAANPLDSELAIPWPIPHGSGMIISEKDMASQTVKEALANG